MPKLIFDDGTTVELSDGVHSTAYGACDTLADQRETDARRYEREGRHNMAAALRTSADKYREASRLLQGG